MRACRELFVLALASASLTACSTAPFWPDGGKPETLPRYGVTPADEDECKGLSNLECVRTKVAKQHSAYADSSQQIHDYKNAANLSLFGLGGAAGVNAVTKGSKTGLQTLGLVAAGIVGLDGTLKADKQYETFGAGEFALRCVIFNDRALDNVREALLGAVRVQDKETATDLNPLSQYLPDNFKQQGTTSPEAAIELSINTVHSELQGASSAAFADVMKGIQASNSREGAASANVVFETHERQRKVLAAAATTIREAVEFRLRIAKISDNERADKLMAALNDVRRAVSNRLQYDNSHLSGIFASLRDAMEAAVKPPQAAAPSATPANTKAETASTLGMLAQAGKIRGLAYFQAALQKANQDLETASAYAHGYEECLTKAKLLAENN